MDNFKSSIQHYDSQSVLIGDSVNGLSSLSPTSLEVDPALDTSNDSSILSRLIKESSTYIEAYNLFSGDKSYGKPFLQELILIPTSITVREPNFWDNVTDFFGGTSGFDKAIVDAFNQAMDAIVALVRDYHTFYQ